MHTLNVINHIFTCLLKRFIVQRQARWRRRWPLLRCWRTTVYIAITQSYCFKCVFECLCASMLQWIFSFYQSIFSSHTQQQTIAIRCFLTNTSATSVDTNEIIISRAYFFLGTNTTVFGWFMWFDPYVDKTLHISTWTEQRFTTKIIFRKKFEQTIRLNSHIKIRVGSIFIQQKKTNHCLWLDPSKRQNFYWNLINR